MTTIANHIRKAADNLAHGLCHEPGIRPNFRGADYFTLAAIIAVILGKGMDTVSTIYTYLSGRECPHDFATVQFILDAYDGDDSHHCVWERNKAGRYSLLDARYD